MRGIFCNSVTVAGSDKMNRLLSEFVKSLEQWRSWNELTVLQNHKQISNYLTDLFRGNILVSFLCTR